MTMVKRLFLLVIGVLFIYNCSSSDSVNDDSGSTSCNFTDIPVTAGDSIAVPDVNNPIYWKGVFTNSTIETSYTQIVDVNGETETLTFVFSKKACIEISHVFKHYDGKNFDTTNITEAQVLDYGIKEYVENEILSGFVTYIDPHDKRTYSKKFYVSLNPKPNVNPKYFSDCFGSRLPLQIDMDGDGTNDFTFETEINPDSGNNPAFTTYKVLLKSNSSDNAILSPIRNQEPYFVIFEPPFSSQNTRQYFGGVKNALDIFYEFEAPYEEFNLFLNNNLTYSEILNNSLEDYYLVSMNKNGNLYYGWIKFTFSSENCSLNVLDKYLHPTPNEHISVN